MILVAVIPSNLNWISWQATFSPWKIAKSISFFLNCILKIIIPFSFVHVKLLIWVFPLGVGVHLTLSGHSKHRSRLHMGIRKIMIRKFNSEKGAKIKRGKRKATLYIDRTSLFLLPKSFLNSNTTDISRTCYHFLISVINSIFSFLKWSASLLNVFFLYKNFWQL